MIAIGNFHSALMLLQRPLSASSSFGDGIRHCLSLLIGVNGGGANLMVADSGWF